MISSSNWVRGSLAGRPKPSRSFVCLRCASTLRSRPSPLLSVLSTASPESQIYGHRYGASVRGRAFHGGRKDLSPSKEPVPDDHTKYLMSRPDVGRKDPIRTYLSKWQPDSESANIDPIGVPTGDAPVPISQFKGNMLTDELVHQSREQKLMDMMKFGNIEADEDECNPFLRPGDMVLLQQGSSFSDGQLAVYVCSVNDQQQFYTIRGKWRVTNPNDPKLPTNERIPTELLTPILPYLPTSAVSSSVWPSFSMEGGIPRPLGAPILSLMTEFDIEAQKLYAEHSTNLSNIYNFLADEDEVLVITLDEIALKALGRDPKSLSKPERFAVHKAIKRYSFYMVPNQSLLTIESYTIRPKRQSKRIDDVVQWVREYQNIHAKETTGRGKGDLSSNPLKRFLEKARKLVSLSRQSREPTQSYSIGPAAKDSSSSPDKNLDKTVFASRVENFSGTDQAIIDYLRLWILPPFTMTDGKLRSTGPTILKNIGMYDDYQYGQSTGYLFLQEIGILSPWENLHLLTEQLALPGHGVSSASDKIIQESKDFCQQLKPDTLTDSMKHLRKNWGNLKVFCVDSPSAAEIDDGFSLEPVPDSEDTFWVHIHVANPSAFISNDNPLAKRAAYFKRSLYSPERIYPMFPPVITDNYFSLGPKKPTITFSAKVNLQGDILETNVTNGVINEVVYITPDRLRKLLGIDRDEVPEMVLNVGDTLKEPTRNKLQKNISTEDEKTLKSLEKVLAARREHRVKKGALEFISHHKSQPFVSAGKKKIRSYIGDNSKGFVYSSDPSIKISGHLTDPYETPESTKHDLVSHAMLLGGEIAAQWCKDRGIPLIFSGTSYLPGSTITPSHDSNPSPLIQLPRGFTSSKPAPHIALGMDQYSKCTSPLRRYSDLLAHWQIEAAIRHEAESNCRFIPEKDNALLPFSEQDVDAIIARSDWQNRLADRAQIRSRDFWTLQLLFRAFYFNQAKLPETFQCVILTQLAQPPIGNSITGESHYIANLLPFRMRCLVSADKDTPSFQSGDLVEVKILHINLYTIFINVMATQLVKRPDPKAASAALGIVG